MKTRVLSALIMAPLFIVVFLGGWFLLVACFLIGVIGVREYFNGWKHINIHPYYFMAIIGAVLLYLNHVITHNMLGTNLDFLPDTSLLDGSIQMLFLIFGMIAVLPVIFGIIKGLFPKYLISREILNGAITGIGIFYIITLSYHVLLIDDFSFGYDKMIWFIFLAAFGTDIMAYFSGMLFGRHKLCPKISPKKTVEGSMGGILGSIILCGIFGRLLFPEILGHCLMIGVLGSIVAQAGDLTASAFKRKMGIKDYGNLIPGHGGILDRFDSVLFTAPFIYYYTLIFIM